MPIEVDPRFTGSGRVARRRQKMRMLRRMGLPALAGLCVLGLVALLVVLFTGGEDVALEPEEEGDVVFVQSEDTAQSELALVSAASDIFLNIRGEPMIILLPETLNEGGAKRTVLTEPIGKGRVSVGTEVHFVEDFLLDASANLQLTLPSSSADLAAFQARRATALDAEPASLSVLEDTSTQIAERGEVVTVTEDDGSWGTVIGEDTEEISYIETSIENTTTQISATRSDRRGKLFDERILRGREETDLAELMAGTGIDDDEMQRLLGFLETTATATGLDPAVLTNPAPDSVVALRLIDGRVGAKILQMSFYGADQYYISLAQARAGRFERAADPWLGENLITRMREENRRFQERGEVRLKDAVYSATLRNGLPSELVGELLVMLSRSQDLDRIASRQDTFRVLYAPDGNATSPAGQILYAALEGPDLDFKCYVLRPDDSASPYGCFDGTRPHGGSGFLIPVSGTKTSNFGPRRHPILKKMMNHNGVDWGAPTGTPVQATAAGRVAFAGQGGGYGNVVYIEHSGGVESRYAHLDAFAPDLEAGATVSAGQLIGFVGSTGRSTGPHLHFEIHVSGTPVDPLTLLTSGSGSTVASNAVEALVAQIIRVESAGNTRAKNPLSSATGLGQFIDSTWLRMMRTYRPDLVASLSQAELLELRFDPGLSRTMVTNLARENESFLRSRGHAITAGRLYLAHFLGPSGASTALQADPNASVLEVMGATIVNANPFLKGKTVKWMTDWSDGKMASVTSGTSNPNVQVSGQGSFAAPVPEDVKAYKKAVNDVLAAL